MRSVDIDSSMKINKVARNSRIIYNYSKYGARSLAKVNPSLVFIDAAISLGELFVSLANYAAIRKQNAQLEIQLATLAHEFRNIQKSLDMKEEQFENELRINGNIISERLDANRQNYEILNAIYKNAEKYFLLMRNEVERYRKLYPCSSETRKIVVKYHEAMTSYIQTSSDVIGG
ncbi:MAG: hypothetical protein JJW00_04300 [Sulfurimonas sp.]|nr:hypothetical protein [Sulfurimonas sp.]